MQERPGTQIWVLFRIARNPPPGSRLEILNRTISSMVETPVGGVYRTRGQVSCLERHCTEVRAIFLGSAAWRVAFPGLAFLVGSMPEVFMQKIWKRMLGLVFALGFTAAIAGAQAPNTAQTSSAADCTELPAVAAKLERADKILHDWPNLVRYGEANAKIVAPAKSEQRVVFMGDSI